MDKKKDKKKEGEPQELEEKVNRKTKKPFVPSPLSSESSDDPVRLYLKEIGQVDLLDVDHEFWLATRVEAPKRLAQIISQDSNTKRGSLSLNSVCRDIYNELCNHWKHILEDTEDLNFDPPDFLEVFKEAQELQISWELQRKSYIRGYLNNGMWSQNEDWDEIARIAFKLFTAIYLLPKNVANQLREYYEEKGKLPPKRIFARYLKGDEEIQEDH